jgi:uncharacterized protein
MSAKNSANWLWRKVQTGFNANCLPAGLPRKQWQIVTMDFLLVVLGVVMIVEGIPWFLSPGSYKRLLLHLLPVSDAALRLCGLTCMLGGLLLVYLVKG